MPVFRPFGFTMAAAILAAGCSFSDEVLWPSLTGGEPAGTPAAAQTTQAQGSSPRVQTAPVAPPPAMGNTTYQPVAVTSATPTGTFVGQKATELRGQLAQLQNSLSGRSASIQAMRAEAAQAAERYHALIAAINARLQIGSTPGNPVLTNQWNQATAELDRMSDQVGRLNGEANGVASDSTLAAFILESVRAAYGLSGAMEEDHRQLNVLEDEVNKAVVSIDRLLNELAGDVSRQSTYISRERSNLTTLSVAIKNGELFGQSLANRAFTSQQMAGQPGGGAGPRRPLVVIRFDNANVEYEQALYTALKGALERKPDATFDLVAVAPSRGPAAQTALKGVASKRHADQVMRSMTNMGLPTSRVSMSSATSDTAESSEVHIYVR